MVFFHRASLVAFVSLLAAGGAVRRLDLQSETAGRDTKELEERSGVLELEGWPAPAPPCGHEDHNILPFGVGVGVEDLAIGIKVWEDRNYTLAGSIPAEMWAARFYRLAHHKIPDHLWFSGMTVGSTLFICSLHDGRDCGYPWSLPSHGFTPLLDAGLSYQGIHMFDFNIGTTTCYKKVVDAASFALPSITTEECVQAVAVKCAEGWPAPPPAPQWGWPAPPPAPPPLQWAPPAPPPLQWAPPAPLPAPQACFDVPDWQSNEGQDCSDYVGKSYCTASRGYGSGWLAEWGTFDLYSSGGYDATTACCGCGRVPSMLPPIEATRRRRRRRQ